MATEYQTMLKISRSEVSQKLQNQITQGEELLKNEIDSQVKHETFRHEGRAWLDYNKELLRRIFTTDEVLKEYSRDERASTDFDIFADQEEREIDELTDEIREKLPRLHSILRRLELFTETNTSPQETSSADRELKLLFRQATELRQMAIKIEPEAADKPGRPGSGITEVIKPYNSYLVRAKRVFWINDPEAFMAVGEIAQQQEIQERLASSYHKTARQRILNGLSDLLAILESRIAGPSGENVLDDKTFHAEIYSKCHDLYVRGTFQKQLKKGSKSSGIG